MKKTWIIPLFMFSNAWAAQLTLPTDDGVPTQDEQINKLPPELRPVANPTIPKSKMKSDVWDNIKEMSNPLTPDMINEYRKARVEDWIVRDMNTPTPKPNVLNSRTMSMTLNPGESPPTIHLARGIASSINISSKNGYPWPIVNYVVGDSKRYNVQTAGPIKDGTNTLIIQPLQFSGQTDIVLALKGLPVAVILMLDTTSGHIDSRVDLTINKRGPDDKPEEIKSDNLPATDQELLQGFMDGVPPKGAHKRTTDDFEVQAYGYKGDMYVCTSKNLLSPGWFQSSQNISGQHVYRLKSAPVLLFSDNGHIREVSVK